MILKGLKTNSPFSLTSKHNVKNQFINFEVGHFMYQGFYKVGYYKKENPNELPINEENFYGLNFTKNSIKIKGDSEKSELDMNLKYPIEGYIQKKGNKLSIGVINRDIRMECTVEGKCYLFLSVKMKNGILKIEIIN